MPSRLMHAQYNIKEETQVGIIWYTVGVWPRLSIDDVEAPLAPGAF